MQPGELIASTLRQHFDAAVMIITNPTGNTQNVRLALDEPTEAYALDASADEITTGLDRFFRGSHEKKLLIADFRLFD